MSLFYYFYDITINGFVKFMALNAVITPKKFWAPHQNSEAEISGRDNYFHIS